MHQVKNNMSLVAFMKCIFMHANSFGGRHFGKDIIILK